MSVRAGTFDPFRKVGEDLYKCDSCRRTVRKKDTLILYNRRKRRQYRVCRDCQLAYYLQEMKELHPGVDIGLKVVDASKKIKDGL